MRVEDEGQLEPWEDDHWDWYFDAAERRAELVEQLEQEGEWVVAEFRFPD